MVKSGLSVPGVPTKKKRKSTKKYTDKDFETMQVTITEDKLDLRKHRRISWEEFLEDLEASKKNK